MLVAARYGSRNPIISEWSNRPYGSINYSSVVRAEREQVRRLYGNSLTLRRALSLTFPATPDQAKENRV